jgi:hypothetical protein
VTEADLLVFLKEGRLQFPPLQVKAVETEATRTADNTVLESDTFLTLG